MGGASFAQAGAMAWPVTKAFNCGAEGVATLLPSFVTNPLGMTPAHGGFLQGKPAALTGAVSKGVGYAVKGSKALPELGPILASVGKVVGNGMLAVSVLNGAVAAGQCYADPNGGG